MTTALVGDRSPNVRSHTRVLGILELIGIDGEWIGTGAVTADLVARYAGVWLLPGSPYRSEAGALTAVRTARERGIPFLGTCGGFQHVMIEYARDVCGLAAPHAESSPTPSRTR